jgi:hypothetical protein
MTPNCERWCSESFLVKEVDTESQNLSIIAAAGLAALDPLEHGGHTDQSWKNRQLAAVQQVQKIKGQLLLSGMNEEKANLWANSTLVVNTTLVV